MKGGRVAPILEAYMVCFQIIRELWTLGTNHAVAPIQGVTAPITSSGWGGVDEPQDVLAHHGVGAHIREPNGHHHERPARIYWAKCRPVSYTHLTLPTSLRL